MLDAAFRKVRCLGKFRPSVEGDHSKRIDLPMSVQLHDLLLQDRGNKRLINCFKWQRGERQREEHLKVLAPDLIECPDRVRGAGKDRPVDGPNRETSDYARTEAGAPLVQRLDRPVFVRPESSASLENECGM